MGRFFCALIPTPEAFTILSRENILFMKSFIPYVKRIS
jgi:hypothetical protein